MRTQSRTGRRRIRLYRIAFVQKAFFIYLLKQIPESLNIAVVVCDVRMFHIHPVPYLLRKRNPLPCIFHHLLAAGVIVFLDGYPAPYVFLRNAEFLLHAQLDRQAVSIPAGSPFHAETALRLVAADSVLYGTRHHMMYPGHAVCRRRPLEKDETRSILTLFHRLLETLFPVPLLKNFLIYRHRVKPFVLSESHNILYNFPTNCKDTIF